MTSHSHTRPDTCQRLVKQWCHNLVLGLGAVRGEVLVASASLYVVLRITNKRRCLAISQVAIINSAAPPRAFFSSLFKFLTPDFASCVSVLLKNYTFNWHMSKILPLSKYMLVNRKVFWLKKKVQNSVQLLRPEVKVLLQVCVTLFWQFASLQNYVKVLHLAVRFLRILSTCFKRLKFFNSNLFNRLKALLSRTRSLWFA